MSESPNEAASLGNAPFAPWLVRAVNGGTQHVYRFPNDYGASVVRSQWTYGGKEGRFELGVVTFTGKNDWHLTYDTPITTDVIGWLDDAGVRELLDKIAALPNASTES